MTTTKTNVNSQLLKKIGVNMNKVKYAQRDCKDQEKIEKFLKKSRTGVIAMNGDDYPYAVPVNFVWYEGSIFFHGMGSGKKVDILCEEPPVSFTVYEEIGTVTDPMPCHADTSYMSVMVFGKIEKVVDFEIAATTLWKLVEKYLPNYYKKPLTGSFIENYKSSMDGNTTAVFKLTPEDITAKENQAEESELFKN
jgi:hypothetical protein